MKTSTLDFLIWVLVYGGLLAACLGLAVRQTAGGWSLGLIGGGLVVALVGFGLIYVRSRLKDDA